MSSCGVHAEQLAEDPDSWRDFARNWLREHRLPGAVARPVHAPSERQSPPRIPAGWRAAKAPSDGKAKNGRDLKENLTMSSSEKKSPPKSSELPPAAGVRTGLRAADLKQSFLDNLFCGLGRAPIAATPNDAYTALGRQRRNPRGSGRRQLLPVRTDRRAGPGTEIPRLPAAGLLRAAGAVARGVGLDCVGRTERR